MIALYKKTHRKTGLKYLGQTSQDPFSYKGSGVRWTRHINKHGYDVDTEVVMWCDGKKSAKSWGIYYSDLWNVVIDPTWANLKREEGDGGWSGIISDVKKGRLETDRIMQERYGDTWRSELGKIAHRKAKEERKGIYAEEYISTWRKNKKIQQMGNSPEARKKAVVSQKNTFAAIGHSQGEKNSQHGTMWITNDRNNAKIKKDQEIPFGWRPGRIMGLKSLPRV